MPKVSGGGGGAGGQGKSQLVTRLVSQEETFNLGHQYTDLATVLFRVAASS